MKTTHFRRFFLTIISVLMVGVFSCICVSADELDTAEPIKLGQEKSITAYKGEEDIFWSHYYKFTAPYTGLFEVSSTPFEDNSIKVTDLEGHDISYAEYNPYTKRVESAVDLVKGRVYYIEIHGNEFYSEYSQVEIRTSIKNTVTDWDLIPTSMNPVQDCFIENAYARIVHIEIYSLNASLAFQSSRKAKRNSRQESATNMITGRSKYSTRQTKSLKKQNRQLYFIPKAKPSKS